MSYCCFEWDTLSYVALSLSLSLSLAEDVGIVEVDGTSQCVAAITPN